MSTAAARTFGALLSVAAVALCIAVFVSHWLGSSAGAEGEILTALKRTESSGLTQQVPGTPKPLVSSHHQFARILVSVRADQGEATVTSTLDFTGSFGATQVSSLGLERTFLRREAGFSKTWEPVRGWSPTLLSAISALERRRLALEKGDREALKQLQGPAGVAEDPELERVLSLSSRSYEVNAWYIRSEKGELLVREEFRLIGALPDRPVDELGNRTLTLHSIAGEFFFDRGLM